MQVPASDRGDCFHPPETYSVVVSELEQPLVCVE